MANKIQWFSDSPDAGDPACKCSYCGKVIKESDVPAIRFWECEQEMDNMKEARLHEKCFQECMDKEIITLSENTGEFRVE